jgi:hypothetical protein
MPKIIYLPTFRDKSGKLCVIEKILKFKIKRVFFIYDIKDIRGGHGHKKTKQFILCLNGSCEIQIKNKKKKSDKFYTLSKPNKGLLLHPDDWHTMRSLKKNTILLVVSSEYFMKGDYICSE